MGKRSIEEHNNWILDIERRLPVEQWMIDGVHIWPLLRTRLNFLFFTSEGGSTKRQPVQRYISLSALLKTSWALLKFLVKPTGKMPVVGADFAAYRSMLNGKLTDKYFDPIFDSFEGRYPALIVEYNYTEGLKREDYYRPDRILRFHEFKQLLHILGLLGARLATPDYQLPGYDEFLTIIEKDGVDTLSYRKENVRRSVAIILAFKWFWKKLYKKTGAKVAIGLCFYTEPLYGMILAARETGVVSVDLQHGGQGKTHLPYAQYIKMPAMGEYNLLPHYFWVWDDSSLTPIQEWIDATKSKHKAIQKGHPWPTYIRSRKWPQLDNEKNLALLSLQSYDLSAPQDLIDDYIASAIAQTVHEFKYFVRLHPRQLPLRGVLKSELERRGLLEYVDIDNANDLPMPAILAKACVHITKSSGSAIEAAIMGVPNVILDEHGAIRYQEYIQKGQASLYLGKDSKELADVIRAAAGRQGSVPVETGTNSWDFILDLQ